MQENLARKSWSLNWTLSFWWQSLSLFCIHSLIILEKVLQDQKHRKKLFHIKRNLCKDSQIIMHEILCPWFQYMNLLQFFFKEELALKVFIWERKNKDISVKTRTFARPLAIWWTMIVVISLLFHYFDISDKTRFRYDNQHTIMIDYHCFYGCTFFMTKLELPTI